MKGVFRELHEVVEEAAGIWHLVVFLGTHGSAWARDRARAGGDLQF